MDYVLDQLEEDDWDDNTLIDLADEDGHLKYLLYQPPMLTLSKLIKPRSTLVAIKIERNEDGSYKPFVPLTQNIPFKPKFMERLRLQREKMEKARLERARKRKEQQLLMSKRHLESVRETSGSKKTNYVMIGAIIHNVKNVGSSSSSPKQSTAKGSKKQ
ncbi:uncharacterized protein LOC144432894 isoform X2 [Glandiceps talaboti]